MTDREWKRLIERASTAARLHADLVQQAEEEYERRYGVKPADVDDDFWIDTVHYGSAVNFAEIKRQAACQR